MEKSFINENFFIHHLLGSEDYRLKEISKFDSSAKDVNGFEDVKDFLQRTFNQDLAEKTEFLANNRKFRCFGCSDNYKNRVKSSILIGAIFSIP